MEKVIPIVEESKIIVKFDRIDCPEREIVYNSNKLIKHTAIITKPQEHEVFMCCKAGLYLFKINHMKKIKNYVTYLKESGSVEYIDCRQKDGVHAMLIYEFRPKDCVMGCETDRTMVCCNRWQEEFVQSNFYSALEKIPLDPRETSKCPHEDANGSSEQQQTNNC